MDYVDNTFEVVFASKYICATLQYKYTLLEYFCIGCVFSVVYPPFHICPVAQKENH